MSKTSALTLMVKESPSSTTLTSMETFRFEMERPTISLTMILFASRSFLTRTPSKKVARLLAISSLRHHRMAETYLITQQRSPRERRSPFPLWTPALARRLMVPILISKVVELLLMRTPCLLPKGSSLHSTSSQLMTAWWNHMKRLTLKLSASPARLALQLAIRSTLRLKQPMARLRSLTMILQHSLSVAPTV